MDSPQYFVGRNHNPGVRGRAQRTGLPIITGVSFLMAATESICQSDRI